MNDPYYYSRQKWIAGWGVLIGGLFGGFIAWWFAAIIALVIMVVSLVEIYVIGKREVRKCNSVTPRVKKGMDES